MKIAFLSLFFGLITGPYPIELSVNGPVAAVEILLDGQAVARLHGAPWRTEVDFGPELLPREVVARALDSQGQEIGRAEAWANAPNPLTKVDILLEGSEGGPPRTARVVWTHLKGEKPRTVVLTFDGRLLSLDESGRAMLPPHDLKSLHVLSTKVEFSPLETVHRDIAYGGEYGSEISAELTAVPVRVRQGKLPDPGGMKGWLAASGRPVAVAAVEEGPGELYVICSPIAREVSKFRFRRLLYESPAILPTRHELTLDAEDNFRFVFPNPQRFKATGRLSDLFIISQPVPSRVGSVPLVLMAASQKKASGYREAERRAMRIADAVAVAGLEATAANRRRAVLLVLDGRETDQSRLDPATVRRFLAAIRVPLQVWYFERPVPGSPLAAWGEGEVISTRSSLEQAVEKLRADLGSQRILMVQGKHLPQSITLTSQAGPVELVGDGAR